jgi:hypothetical protein
VSGPTSDRQRGAHSDRGVRLERHEPVVVAYDGQPCDPHPLQEVG